VLHDTPREIDFAHYRSILKNQAVVDEIEAAYKAFKPKTYDVSKTLSAIESFEAAAVKNAETTKSKVDAELQNLSMTLKNISEARSFDELTVVCILGRVGLARAGARAGEIPFFHPPPAWPELAFRYSKYGC